MTFQTAKVQKSALKVIIQQNNKPLGSRIKAKLRKHKLLQNTQLFFQKVQFCTAQIAGKRKRAAAGVSSGMDLKGGERRKYEASEPFFQTDDSG